MRSSVPDWERILRVAIVGLGGAGKSCLALRYISNTWVDEYDPTLEETYRKKYKVGDNEYFVDIYDTTGQEEMQDIRDQYIKGADGFLVCYDVSSDRSFRFAEDLIGHIKQMKRGIPPLIVIGNKVDLDPAEREVTLDQGKALADKLGVSFFEASAKTDSSVKEAFIEIIDAVRKAKAKIIAEIAIQNSDDLKLKPHRTSDNNNTDNKTYRQADPSVKTKKPKATKETKPCSCTIS
jgi:GTPase KRas protein